MTSTETIECIQACTVTFVQGTDFFGPGVGLAGVLIGGLIGLLGLRWQHKQNHRQVILREVAQMHSALRDAWEISSELRTTANPSASVKPMPVDTSNESLAKLEISKPPDRTVGRLTEAPCTRPAGQRGDPC
jgi:hypothetical protein